ncbi:RES domain-containing protein [Altererythrobacter indicus]|uniref:RES domain-containing protein n=1 Tax=Altericroceibacterium indicum TaxID=374177 RepID=A0A845A6Z8_9SPHN|nr:RES family NAD+ phosphorylase [Altericroceibacterium indicum]MXP25139.1 RES domain-containing protein [Altericroceibacterium indicum]
MKLWRLTRESYLALDGSGPMKFGGRYSSPGRPVVNFASEAGLAVLVALRYALEDRELMDADHLLGWTEIDDLPERVPNDLTDGVKIAFVDTWLDSGRSLLAAVSSAVLPEADIVLMNPRHPDAARIRPLTVRPFKFSECLHRPPMLDKYRQE